MNTFMNLAFEDIPEDWVCPICDVKRLLFTYMKCMGDENLDKQVVGDNCG